MLIQGGFSPFYNACLMGHVEVVKLLLADNRVDVNKVEQVIMSVRIIEDFV